GRGFIRACGSGRYPVKAGCTGPEIARRAALAEGLAVTPLANGFAATSDPARLQELCDLVQAGTVRVFFETWMSRIPLPLTGADRDHGCWRQLAMPRVGRPRPPGRQAHRPGRPAFAGPQDGPRAPRPHAHL